MQLFFATTLLLSATLLFVVEPMFAKMVLPMLGGSPSVWNTCLVFYQAALLAGYVYAHLSVRWLGVRRQAVLHLLLLCLPWLVLPIGVASGWAPPRESNPVPWLWMLLTVSIGLPFLCVSATAPLLQAWFSETGHRTAKDPYFLYAASNVGSMIALAAYPLVIESHLTLAEQSGWWAAGYGLLMAMIAACAAGLWMSRPDGSDNSLSPRERPTCGRCPGMRADGSESDPPAQEMAPLPEAVLADREQGGPHPDPLPEGEGESDGPSDRPLTFGRRLRWVVLSLVPSSLLLGATAHLSTDIASVPMLWVIPLMFYLLSFVLVFARRQIFPHRWALRAQAGFLPILAAVFYLGGLRTSQIVVLFGLHVLAFFLTAMACHGELAADRPASRHLTEFYVWMSVGGVLGGLFNTLVAPLVFSTVVEYPLMLAAACLLRPRPAPTAKTWLKVLEVALMVLLIGVLAAMLALVSGHEPTDYVRAKIALLSLAAIAAFLLQRRPTLFAVSVAIVMVMSLACSGHEVPLYCARSFFGVLRVEKEEFSKRKTGEPYEAHRLLHGSTLHGMQSTDPEEALEPWTYYHRTGPVGDVFDELESRRPFRLHGTIGVVGLGTGSIAAYGLAGQHLTYFEIDPAVERIARNPEYFTYLRDCKADLEVRLGDARLSLADEPDGRFDVLLVDAFSSDAIPLHLLTREAVALYFDKLATGGLLMVHVSNRHLDLKPVLGNLADALHLIARARDDDDEEAKGKCGSNWVVLARRTQDLGALGKDADWTPVEPSPDQRLWTDDFSNIIGVVDWRHLNWDWLKVWNLWRRK